MNPQENKHIIIIGFKHVGKSILGRALAWRLRQTHLDLDIELEKKFHQDQGIHLKCREIMQQKGEYFFRNLEHQTLVQILTHKPCVVSLGGGAPMLLMNQVLIASHCVVYISASPKQVFQRIMHKGRPAFFSEKENPWHTFSRLWEERGVVYRKLATITVKNDGSVVQTVKKIMEKLNYLSF